MFLNAGLSAALDRVAERAADVRRAFTPGALPVRGDVATVRARLRATVRFDSPAAASRAKTDTRYSVADVPTDRSNR
jgi:hypothetical protein